MTVRAFILPTIILASLSAGCACAPKSATTAPLPTQQGSVPRLTFKDWELLPSESAVPVDTREATVVGVLSGSDRQRIAGLVGRLKGVYPKIHHITACFEYRAVAAKAKAGPQEIYCVKDIYGEWSIVAVDTWIP